MLHYMLGVMAALLLLSSSAQAWAPYVGASEADNEFYRITPAQMAVLTAKKGMVTSRSFGQNMMGGLGRMGAKNPTNKFYYTTNLINLLGYPTTPLTSLPSGFFAPTSSYAPNNRILHYLCQITPMTNRIDHFNYYLATAPYNYANDVEWGFIEYHMTSEMDMAFFISYKDKMAAMTAAYPNLKSIYVTAGLLPKADPANDVGWIFSDRVLDPANGLFGVVPIYDWRSILSTHADGTSAGHMMCPEFNTGDLTHPNQPFIEERLGKALIMMLYKIYCDPPLTANAGFDRVVYDDNNDGSHSVTLDGAASYDPHHQIVNYTWREGDTVLASSASPTAAVNLGLGTHNLILTVTSDAAPAGTSTDPVTVTVAKPKLVIANAGTDQFIINLPSNPHTIAEGVQVDGGGSTALDGRTIVSYLWVDTGRVVSTSRTANLNMENGVHRLCLTVTDSAGNTDTDTTFITIVESTARTTDGLQALYTFKDGSGTIVKDVSCSYATPLNLTIANPAAVTWTAGGGLTVNSETLIASPDAATRLYDACLDLGDVTLEAWVQPSAAVQNGPAAIMSLATDHSTRNFTLSQGLAAPDSAACYGARFRATGTSANGDPLLASAAGTATTSLQHVVYVRQGNSLDTLYINGAQVATGIHEGLLNVWSNTNRLALANEIVGGRPWLGKFQLAAIYNRILSLDEIGRNYAVGTSPAIPAAPRVLGWQAALQRGGQDQELLGLTDAPLYTDGRQGALDTIRIVLGKPVNPATVSKASVKVTGTRSGDLASLVSSVTLDATRRVITLQMSAMPAADKVKFELQTTVRDAWNQSVRSLVLPVLVNLNVTVGSLLGDVNGDSSVTLADLLAVRDRIGQPATGGNARYDLDASGDLTSADLQMVRKYLGATLP